MASLAAANAVPKMLACKDPENFYDSGEPMRMEENVIGKANIEAVVGKGFQECYHSHRSPSNDSIGQKPEELTNGERLEKLFAKLDLSGNASWSKQDQRDVTSLIEEYHHLFVLNDLELGKTDLVKHSMKVNDYTPLKERYQWIPCYQYDEVCKHLQEMLNIGAIRKSCSPWASTGAVV